MYEIMNRRRHVLVSTQSEAGAQVEYAALDLDVDVPCEIYCTPSTLVYDSPRCQSRAAEINEWLDKVFDKLRG